MPPRFYCLQGIVPWARARAFFATRLRRRLMEAALVKHVVSTDRSLQPPAAASLVRSWYAGGGPSGHQHMALNPVSPVKGAPCCNASVSWDVV